jgi:adenosine deaminase
MSLLAKKANSLDLPLCKRGIKGGFFLLSILLLLFCIPAMASIESHFATIKSDPNALYAFFKEMPKGGELHYHLAGGAYPESMLALASHSDYCINPETNVIGKALFHCDGVKAKTLATKPELYNQVLRAWSMKDFITGPETGHDHFFASFNKFIPLVNDFRPQLLAEIMKRASNQHELYLEIMDAADNSHSTTFAQLASGPIGFAAKQKNLLANPDFQKNITATVNESKRTLEQARHYLGCDTLAEQPVCTVTVKFQYFVLREQPLDNVFAQALNGFAAAEKSNDIVGVNLVQAEDGIISLRDYQEQMRIFKFLHSTYPNVHIALHAGELAPSDVPPAELRFHIHDAIFTGQAKRIGHGVSIAYEDDADELVNYMAKTPIAVEINLTSNQDILNVSGKNHPLNYYLSHHIPVILSTDDEGILRTDLTREYVKAVSEHGLDYADIKNINRNALTYSFLPGESLWADPVKGIAVNACQTTDSELCQQFIKNNEKARLQWQLEKKLAAFEKNILETTHQENESTSKKSKQTMENP